MTRADPSGGLPRVAEVLAWEPAALAEAAGRLRARLLTMQTGTDLLTTAIDRARGHWHGVAGEAAQARLRDESTRGEEVLAIVRRAADGLGAAGDDLADVRTKLAALVEDARSEALVVHETGQVEALPSALDPVREQLARQHTELIKSALRQAAEADLDATRALRAIRFPEPLDAEAVHLETTDIATLCVPAGAAPATIAAWWRGLSPGDRDRLVAQRPELIGNLDGVPVAVRDRANRLALPGALAGLRSKLAEMSSEPAHWLRVGDPRIPHRENPAWTAWYEGRSRIEQLIAGTEDLAVRLGSPAPAAYFLVGFQPLVGNGRAIIALGDPDKATNVGTFVTGTTTRLGGVGTDLERSRRMFGAAARHRGDGDSLSMVTWYGYDAPQDVLPDAGHLSYAERGAPLLSSFMAGLRATHESSMPSHNTVVAHSYGTTVVGRAASQGHRLDADDVVLVASPGAGVGNGWTVTGTVDDLHLSEGSRGHVYAVRSDSDSIKWATDTHLGVDPVEPDFGAHVLASSPGGGHGDYWDATNPALRGMGEVIAGRGSSLPHAEAPPETRWPWL